MAFSDDVSEFFGLSTLDTRLGDVVWTIVGGGGFNTHAVIARG